VESDTPAVRSWATPANALTATRLLLAPLIVLTIVSQRTLISGAIFVIAVLTDVFDGPLARRRNEASARGALFDHAVDATFVTLGLAALAWNAVLTALLPVLAAAAFVQYMLDSAALRGRQLRASRIGRYNGIGYFVMVGIPVIRDALGLDWPAADVVTFLAWLLVATSIISMTDRAVALAASRR
jgi:phosphatidylglycerophosphate synthase